MNTHTEILIFKNRKHEFQTPRRCTTSLWHVLNTSQKKQLHKRYQKLSSYKLFVGLQNSYRTSLTIIAFLEQTPVAQMPRSLFDDYLVWCTRMSVQFVSACSAVAWFTTNDLVTGSAVHLICNVYCFVFAFRVCVEGVWLVGLV